MKLAEAPTSSAPIDASAVTPPRSAFQALATMVWITAAPSAPTSPAISLYSRPCTASTPKNAPATAITSTSIGASEKAE